MNFPVAKSHILWSDGFVAAHCAMYKVLGMYVELLILVH